MAYHTSDLACGHSDCGGCDDGSEICEYCEKPERYCDCTVDSMILWTKKRIAYDDLEPEEAERLCKQLIELYKDKFKN